MTPIMKITIVALFILGFTVNAVCSAMGTAAHAESFDKPVRTKIVRVGRSKYNPNNREQVQLTCFYYPGLLVKQLVDPGIKGSLWATVLSIANSQALTCKSKHDPEERFISENGWYFVGAKGQYVFLEASEGDDNAGMPFQVLNARTAEKVFEDSTYFYRRSDIKFAHSADGNPVLKYLRVVGGDCSIPKGGASCWIQFRKHYGIVFEAVPVCTGYLRAGDKEGAMESDGTVRAPAQLTSAVAYPVSVALFPHPTITPVPGPVKCEPQP